MTSFNLIGLFLISLTFFTFVCFAQEGRLIVDKDIINTEYPTTNQDVIALYTICNVGEGTAYNVFLKDDSWYFEDFDVLEGSLSAKWDQILPGQNVTHALVLTTDTPGKRYISEGKVLYQPAPFSPRRVSYTTMIGRIDVVPFSSSETRNEPHLMEWLGFIGLSLLFFIPLAIYYLRITYKNKKKPGKKEKK
ncbi:translocon-associated protein subunit beta [Anaeramoeba ignava]|uniref:Translocon-associated protein subunit beta n=1 Tax=Anaeramoeba ignava TaxID=1746090 RepID=A0A9Q0LQN4_ANAIG|nr:translocon-associated protein subunit beta [Anaeramoeba ignava]|eukprot:Anaeramoba_ignava/a610244_59.p1 GENE.a610244_59~~a610244_59.p1  ORF type:complete len:192 (-),score=61.52 a610244_59:55-630(-)